MPLISIFGCNQNPVTEKPFCRIKLRGAKQLLDKGLAVRVGASAVQRTNVPMEIYWPIGCGQGIAYLRYGAEKFRVVLQGGLTRTETRPAPIKPFTGARVGHQ